jgi:uncharacterized protein (TIGR02646 family)
MKKLTPATIAPALLAKLHAKSPALQQKSWGYSRGHSRIFKDAITAQMLVIQSTRCAYCGSRLHGTKHHRDHIAPKESHPEFTFLPENLVLACYTCNSDYKLAADTIATKAAAYANCTFLIIHPHFDEPTDHIHFVPGIGGLLIQVIPGSLKGRATVDMFRLDSPERTKQRIMDAAFESDLDYLPGPWRSAVESTVWANLKVKLRPTA